MNSTRNTDAFPEVLTSRQFNPTSHEEQQMKKIERLSVKTSHSSQHKVLLKLANYSHNRQSRDRNIETLSRLFGSSAIKSKTDTKKNKKKKKSIQRRPETLERQSESRRISTESFSSERSSLVHKMELVTFADEDTCIPRRSRALSVDQQCHPIVLAKRRQSAPEVIVTPANLQATSPLSVELEHSSENKDRLSPSYSVTTEFLDNHSTLSEDKERATNQGVIPKILNRKLTVASVVSSKLSSHSRGGARSKKFSGGHRLPPLRGLGHEKHTHADQAGLAEEFDPIKDPRYLNLLNTLKTVELKRIDHKGVHKTESDTPVSSTLTK